MIALSVIICSNTAPASLFFELSKFKEQEFLDKVEIVIVNNGFSVEKENQINSLLHQTVCYYQITREETPGLGFARRQGFRVAKGRYFVLLDDDNSLDSNFFKTLIEIIDNNQIIGGIGVVVKPIWEKTPPVWLIELGLGFLSYNSFGDYQPLHGDLFFEASQTRQMGRPPGGGMVINHHVAEHYLDNVIESSRIALSRQPKSLIGCEDDDIWAGIFALNLPVFFSDKLKVFHHIPKYRIEYSYLMNLVFGNGYSYGRLDRYRNPTKKYKLFTELKTLIKNNFHLIFSMLSGKINIQVYILRTIYQIGNIKGHLKNYDHLSS